MRKYQHFSHRELKHGFKTDSQNYHIKGNGNYFRNLVAIGCLFLLLSFLIYNMEKASNSEVHSIYMRHKT